ncbi:hypothetical protein D9M69_571480 [compost metagenome]
MHQVAGQRVLFAFVDDVAGARTHARHREHHARIVGPRGHLERRGRRIRMREVEGRAVGHDALRLRQHHLADRQGVPVQRQLAEAPEEPLDRGGALLRRMQHMALKLLEMLRPQEHSLRPDHFVFAHHVRFSSSASKRATTNGCDPLLPARRA